MVRLDIESPRPLYGSALLTTIEVADTPGRQGNDIYQSVRESRLSHLQVIFTGTLPEGTTGKDVIVALCGLFKNDEVLNHAIEFTGSEETMRSLPIDARLTIANQSTEWGGLSGSVCTFF